MGKTDPSTGNEVEYVPFQVGEGNLLPKEVLGMRTVDLLHVPSWPQYLVKVFGWIPTGALSTCTHVATLAFLHSLWCQYTCTVRMLR